jgi:hypothetical protein
MNAQVKRFLHLPALAGGIAAILVSGIVIASLPFSGQESNGAVAPAEAPEAVVAPAIPAAATRARRCAECGVIASVREIVAPDDKAAATTPGAGAAGKRGAIEAKPRAIHEITIRMQDGSMRVITDAKPARWRHGEPVTIIAGVD